MKLFRYTVSPFFTLIAVEKSDCYIFYIHDTLENEPT